MMKQKPTQPTSLLTVGRCALFSERSLSTHGIWPSNFPFSPFTRSPPWKHQTLTKSFVVVIARPCSTSSQRYRDSTMIGTIRMPQYKQSASSVSNTTSTTYTKSATTKKQQTTKFDFFKRIISVPQTQQANQKRSSYSHSQSSGFTKEYTTQSWAEFHSQHHSDSFKNSCDNEQLMRRMRRLFRRHWRGKTEKDAMLWSLVFIVSFRPLAACLKFVVKTTTRFWTRWFSREITIAICRLSDNVISDSKNYSHTQTLFQQTMPYSSCTKNLLVIDRRNWKKSCWQTFLYALVESNNTNLSCHLYYHNQVSKFWCHQWNIPLLSDCTCSRGPGGGGRDEEVWALAFSSTVGGQGVRWENPANFATQQDDSTQTGRRDTTGIVFFEKTLTFPSAVSFAAGAVVTFMLLLVKQKPK